MTYENLIEIRILLYCKECKTKQMHRIYKKDLKEVIFSKECVKCKKNIISVDNIWGDSIHIHLKII